MHRIFRRRLKVLVLISLFVGLLCVSKPAAEAVNLSNKDNIYKAVPSIAMALQTDGSLKPTARGSFNAENVSLSTASNGTPIFTPLTTAITNTWDTRFANALPFTGTIKVLALAPNGDLYVGGEFKRIHTISAANIARWDGQQWSALGNERSMVGDVRSIAFDGNDVYVGGNFNFFDATHAEGIARWDGTMWHSVGTGFGSDSPNVTNIAFYQGNLFIAGSFNSFSGTTAYNFVRWDGTKAYSVTSDLQAINQLVATSYGLYVDGYSNYSSNQTATATSLRVWDGTKLVPMPGIKGGASSLEVIDDELYMIGFLSWNDEAKTDKIIKWDGTSWTTIAPTIPYKATYLTLIDGDVYVSARYGDTIYRWSGSIWETTLYHADLIQGIIGTADSLYIATIDDPLIHYNGNQREQIDVTHAGRYVTMNARNGVAYIGTSPLLKTHVTSPTDHLFRWENGVWQNIWNVPTPWMSFSKSVILPDDSMYIRATTTNGTEHHIYHYTDGILSVLPDPPLPYASAWTLVLSGTDLLVAGDGVQRWTGAQWADVAPPLESGIIHNAFVLDGQVYVFRHTVVPQPGAWPVLDLLRWTGSQWLTVIPSMQGWINDVATNSNAAYFVGEFQNSDGTIRNIARWDGTTLTGLGASNGRVQAIDVRDDIVYVGGIFSQLGTCDCNNIGRWDGFSWSPLGIGTNGMVEDVAIDGGDVYIRGSFDQAGDVPALGMSIWHESAPDLSITYLPLLQQ